MVDFFLSTNAAPSSTVHLKVIFRDSSGNIVSPTTNAVSLFDLNGVQRNPTNTALTTSTPSTMLLDSSGTVTGTAGAFYLTTNFHSGAATSTTSPWTLQISNTYQSVSTTKTAGFYVFAGGATPGSADTTYCTVQDVVRMFARNGVSIDANTLMSTTDVETLIERVEDTIDAAIGRTYKPTKAMRSPDGTGLLLNVIFNRRSPLFLGYNASAKVPVGPIQDITKLEIISGETGYTDITSLIDNEGRPDGVWFDPNGDEVFFGSNVSLPILEKNAIRIQYVAGLGTGGFQTIPGNITDAATLLTMSRLAQSQRWSYTVPEGLNTVPVMVQAREWERMAWDLLNISRGIVWS